MSEFVESLRRLYEANKVDANKLRDLRAGGRLTKEEYQYIVKKEGR